MKKSFSYILLLIVFSFFMFSTWQPIFAQDNVTSRAKIEKFFIDSRAYKNQDKIDLALDSLEKSLALAQEIEDEKSVIDCYHEFSLLYLKLNKIDQSILFWDRAEVILKDLEYPYGNAVHKYIDALHLYKQEKYYLANFELDKATQMTNVRNLTLHILLAKGFIYLELPKYDDAIKHFNSLIVNNDSDEKDYIATRAYIGLTLLKIKTQQPEKAIQYGKQGLELAEKNKFFYEIQELNEILAATSETLGNFEASLIYSKKLIQIKDSVYNVSKINSETKTANSTEFTLLNNIINNQDKEIEKLKESGSRTQIVIILTSAFLTIISLLAVSLYRNNQIKLKTNDLLQTKNTELEASRDAAVKAMETKTNFLSTVSHELRTPLYAVTGLTHLLLEENPSESQKEHLKALKFSGDYLLSFINDILQLNKIDADKLEPVNTEFNLKKVLTEVISSLQQSARENNTKIVLEHDEKIPNSLLSDSMKISQILINLVGNGLKFTKGGEVTVITKLAKKEEENVTIYFEIKDNGIGISKDQIINIFDSFEQGSIQINREYGGTGLGLTIVKSLLGLFNSKINLKSELGKGSSFFFEIDMLSNDNDAVQDIGFEIADQEFDFKGLNLLIVEDNKINQVITKKMLLKKEMTCDIASNGTDAVEMVSQNKYDAILMDIHMPGISGDEATILIRKFNKKVPIIALTAISLDDSLEVFYAAGCNDVVTKPFKPEVFYQKIGENIFFPKPLSSS
ncbi:MULTISPECIES: tetratricopeptide repeat-containing hybrid sensor histidine kinase/response regulator [Cellulophaga]|uniref:tetratricopeptide repeat-containing hybrid sensor histidine kinase/response regulator n=1 Tax=Cellulophaga TaxID=104264 RepID=UPI00209121CA|nr:MULTISPECIES: response regulator [Cellulophaga]MDO6766391.1 ATP-binding protein [Cellulophaga sp. 1_MG-2023]